MKMKVESFPDPATLSYFDRIATFSWSNIPRHTETTIYSILVECNKVYLEALIKA